VGATACVSASNAYECVCEQLEVAGYAQPPPSRQAGLPHTQRIMLLFHCLFVVTRRHVVVANRRVWMTPLRNPRHRRYINLRGALQPAELHSIALPE
jgi:hypothetical protein